MEAELSILQGWSAGQHTHPGRFAPAFSCFLATLVTETMVDSSLRRHHTSTVVALFQSEAARAAARVLLQVPILLLLLPLS